MIGLRVVFYLGLLGVSVAAVNVWFALSIAAVVALLDAYVSHLDMRRVMPHLVAAVTWFLLGSVLVFTGVVSGTGIPVLLAALVYLSMITGRKMPCAFAEGRAALPVDAELPCTKILDASILMDGRVLDIVEIGFLDGTIVVPRFVMQQVQHVYESGAEMKKQRAKMALDLIRKLQNMKNLQFRICEIDFPGERDIDHRIISLAQKLKARIVTNDYTLNRVASLKEIEVLNINELANALKPVALPGEIIQVQLLKKGKEEAQAIGYLDDGTMVVVDGGEAFIGSRVDASITSVLQNPAGKMIFGRIESESPSNGQVQHDA